MKATLEELQALGLEVLKGEIVSVRFSVPNSLLIKVVLEDDEDEDEILLEISNKDLEEYYEYYTLSGVITARRFMLEHLTICRAMLQDLGKLDHETNTILTEDFLHKEVIVLRQELDSGDAIIQLNGKAYVNAATKSWTKYLLYSWG